MRPKRNLKTFYNTLKTNKINYISYPKILTSPLVCVSKKDILLANSIDKC